MAAPRPTRRRETAAVTTVRPPTAAELRDYLGRHRDQLWRDRVDYRNCPLAYCLYEGRDPTAVLSTKHSEFTAHFVDRFDDELARRRQLSGADCLDILDQLANHPEAFVRHAGKWFYWLL